jgi:isopenicillin-N N-acyltransferase-like protein
LKRSGMAKRIFKIIAWFLGILVALLLILLFYVRVVSMTEPPPVAEVSLLEQAVAQPDSGLFTLGNNWFRKSNSGLYELYVEGEPHERGIANGKLTSSLVHYQEEVFTDQIHRLVPNAAYLQGLKYFVGWFNRDLAENVTEEFKEEIFGVSQSASHEFDNIAPPYQRILNYHAAHDIGHALQNMSLVG